MKQRIELDNNVMFLNQINISSTREQVLQRVFEMSQNINAFVFH
jgi:hypothetical protein